VNHEYLTLADPNISVCVAFGVLPQKYHARNGEFLVRFAMACALDHYFVFGGIRRGIAGIVGNHPGLVALTA
jgi:hypothetical protein